MHPIREVRKALDATNGSGWTNEAEKAFQKIKRKLNKLQTLTIPKEGETRRTSAPDVNEEETSKLGAELQAELTPTPRAWQLYLSRETIKEGLGVGMILINPEAKTCSYAIRLNFNAPNHIINYKSLLAGLVSSARKGMKDLHVFIDSQIFVDQVEGSRVPATE
ncbi:reverse transcriptase domain-containing protein [Tanacetum coccineum]